MMRLPSTRIKPELPWPCMACFFAASLVFYLKGYNQVARYAMAEKYTGLGAYSKNFVDPFSASANQASLANVKDISVGIYGERRFLLQELSLYNVALCIPMLNGGVGVSATYFGHEHYNETRLGAGYGKALGKVDLGVQFNYHSLQVTGYGKEALFNFEVGAILHISEQIYAGLHVFNPTGSKFGQDHSEKLSAAVRAGLGFEASEKVLTSAEIIKEEDKPVSIHAGLQYVFAKRLFARLGIYTESTQLYFGAGLKRGSFRADITGSYHPQLGFTPGILLIFQPSEKEE